jgi:formate hydrogenlyase transcriptional activator
MPAAAAAGVSDAHETIEEVERAHIRRVLEGTRWLIEGEHGAARILGLNPSTLRGRMRKLDIRRR